MPRFSIFTPTHNPQYYLLRAFRSLLAQTFKDWEWIIVPNGEATEQNVLQALSLDPSGEHFRIKIIPHDSKSIGALKKFACSQTTGEILVELDHDDELTSNCLEELNKAFQDPELDFAYSHCAEVRPEGTPNVYSPAYGWKYGVVVIDGKTMTVLKAFPPTPASFSKVWYGPNHVRAWKKSFYDKIGGHDATRAILDDHDLVARTFIQGKVLLIPKPLYIYYWTGENTCQSQLKNPEIQLETLNIHDRYAQKMVEKWAISSKLPLIELGIKECYPPNGWHPACQKNDIDLTQFPWPFPDSSVGAFRAYDVLQKLDPIKTMREIYRCLIPGGWLLSNTPSTDGRGAWMDPTHISWWNSNSFFYYTKTPFAQPIDAQVRFQCARIKNWYPSDFHKEHDILYVYTDLIALKEEKNTPPGLIEI